MSALSFKFAAAPESGDHEVRPLIDGVDVLVPTADAMLGLDPPYFFRQGALLNGGRLFVARCACGELGCDSLEVTVEVTQTVVKWLSGERVVAEFPTSQYIEAVNRCSLDTSWESLERTAERLAGTVDFSSLKLDGYSFQWASARIGKGKIVLSFAKNGDQRLFDVGWDGVHPEDARQQVSRWLSERT